MAKDKLIFSQHDFGHAINICIKDFQKNIINTKDFDVIVHIVTPDGYKKQLEDAYIVNKDKELPDLLTSGVIGVELPKWATEQIGNHSIYITFLNENASLTATKAVYYYVMDDIGGAEYAD